MGYLVALVRRCAPAGLCPGPQIRIVSANPRLDGRGPPRPSALRVSSWAAINREACRPGGVDPQDGNPWDGTQRVGNPWDGTCGWTRPLMAGKPVGSRRAAAREGTRSAEGLGGPRPSSLGLALTIRIWGPGQSPAGAQRRTKAIHNPAPTRDVHLCRA